MSELRNKYPQISNSKGLDTIVPSNLYLPTLKGLLKFRKLIPNIDSFVTSKLKLKSNDDLFSKMYAEQVDSVAIAINKIETGSGLIIGDQTGIGKGRQAASVIRYCILNGYIPVFLTEKPNLFTAIYRDMIGVGAGDFIPLVLNGESPDKKTDIYDNDNLLKFKAPKDETLRNLIEGSNDLPTGYDYIVATYSQIQTNYYSQAQREMNKPLPKGTYKLSYLTAIAEKCVFILDESHNAAGDGTNVGEYLYDLLSSAKGAIFLSATYAKTPKNMPIYASKTFLNKYFNKSSLIGLFSSGEQSSIIIQELLAGYYAEENEFIRRERSSEGIENIFKVIEDSANKDYSQRVLYDNVLDIIKKIIDFERQYVIPIRMETSQREKSQGSAAKQPTTSLGVNKANFFSKLFNVVSTLLMTIKANDVAEEAISQLNQNRKVVIAIRSTFESLFEYLGINLGDEITLEHNYAKVFVYCLEDIMTMTVTPFNGQKYEYTIPLEQTGADGVKAYGEIMKAIENNKDSLSISPIDVIINKIEQAQRPKMANVYDSEGTLITQEKHEGQNDTYRVIEVTGRKKFVQTDNRTGKSYVKNRKNVTSLSFKEFNNGTFDVIIINQTGSTGEDAHAAAHFRDTRQRVMIIAQSQLDINTEVQIRGRVNRTGQIKERNGRSNLPFYVYLISDIPSEQRLLFMLKEKIKMLDANTTGNQNENTDQFIVSDINNEYGAQAISEFLNENNEIYNEMRRPLHKMQLVKGEMVEVEREVTDIVNTVTASVAILPCEKQEYFYDIVTESVKNKILEAIQNGTYSLEITTKPYKGVIEDRFLLVDSMSKNSVIGGDIYLDKYNITISSKPKSKATIQQESDFILNGKTAREYYQEETDKAKDAYAKYKKNLEIRAAKNIDEINSVIALEQEKLRTEPDEDIKEKIRNKIQQRQQNLVSIQEKLDANKEKFDYILSEILSFFNYFTPLRGVQYSSDFADGTTNLITSAIGVVIGITYKNPSDERDGKYLMGNYELQIAIAGDISTIAKFSFTESNREKLKEMMNWTKSYWFLENEKHIFDKWDTFTQFNNKNKTAYFITNNPIYSCVYGFLAHGQLCKFKNSDGDTIVAIEVHKDHVKDVSFKLERMDSAIVKNDLLTNSKVINTKATIAISSVGNDIYKVNVKKSSKSGDEYYMREEVLKLTKEKTFKQVEHHTGEKYESFMSATIDVCNLSRLLDIFGSE